MTNPDHDKIDTALSADPGVVAGGAAGELGTAAQGTVSPNQALAELTADEHQEDPEGRPDDSQDPGPRPDQQGT